MPGITRNPLFRLHCFGWAFTPNLIPTLGFILLLPLLLKLGFWQLHRAEYKQQLQQQFNSRSIEKPRSLSQLNPANLEASEYYPIKISGHYDNQHQFLLDNRVHKHRVGYDVISPFIPDKDKKALLINRGWIPSTGNRQQLPTLTNIPGHQTIQGIIKLPPKKTFTLSDRTEKKIWPRLIQTINLKKIGNDYPKPLYPFIVLLSPNNPYGYTREWKPIVMSPKKHIGYAVQWFALALTLVIIYLVLNIQRQGKCHEQTRKK